jgi:hypothetical protein
MHLLHTEVDPYTCFLDYHGHDQGLLGSAFAQAAQRD